MPKVRDTYISSLMRYIQLEYDNVPHEVTPEMDDYFNECFDQDPPVCFPNAAGVFWERFMKTSDAL